MADNTLFSLYLVIFLDLLGQQDAIKRIGDDFPASDESREKFAIPVRESLGKVLDIRKTFEEYFHASAKYIPNNTESVPPMYRDEYVSCFQSEIDFYCVSDSIIVSLPLTNENENAKAVKGLSSALVATGAIGLAALAKGIAIRGGIDVGIAAKIDDREIYGPALQKAIYLESELAEYPRFLVGNGLVGYLRWVGKKQFQTPFGEIARIMARHCSEMIFQDTDGRVCLDFLGTKFKEISDKTLTIELIKEAWKFVSSEYERFAKEEDVKLTSRYFRLMYYFVSRKGIWGIN